MGSCVSKQRHNRSLVAPLSPVETGGSIGKKKTSVEAEALSTLRKQYLTYEHKLHRRVKSCYESVLAQKNASVELNLKFVNLGAEGCKHLSVVLQHYSHLQSLCLWKTRIGIAGCEPLGRALHSLPSLKVLSLEDNELRAAGLEQLSDGIICASGLEELYLHANWLGPEGGMILGRVVERLGGLLVLTADENSLLDQSAAALIGALRPAIRFLGLGFNSLTEETGKVLLVNIRRFPSLRKVRLGGTITSEELRKDLRREAPLTHIDY